MFCPKCGASVPEGSKFCEVCGNNMLEQNTQAQPEQPQPEARESQAQPAYQPQPAPEFQNNTYAGADPLEKVYGIGGWVGTMLLMLIPIVNIILIFVWAFGSNTNRNKKNWAIATLIMAAIGIIFSIAFSSIFIGAISNILEQMGGDMYYPY